MAQPISNPKGAFGYPGEKTTASMPRFQGPRLPRIELYRNASTTLPIQPGMPVSLSSVAGSSYGTWVVATQTVNDPLFVGCAITSAGLNTELTTVAGTTGLGDEGSDYCQVVTKGLVYGALLSSAVTAGSLVSPAASTGSTATGTTYAGSFGAALATGTTGGYVSVAGVAHTSGTTGTTGFLTTVGPRGVVFIRPSIFQGSSG